MSPRIGARKRATSIAMLSVLALLALAGSARGAATETPGEVFAASATADGGLAESGVGQDVAISADGRSVAFISSAANLSPEATAWSQAYVKNLESGAVTLASRADGAAGEPAAEPPLSGIGRVFLSADGRYLAFETSSDNLSPDLPPPPAEQVSHVYRRDLASGETEVVDRADGAGGEVLAAAARVVGISADGSQVAFSDQAEGLGGPTGAQPGEETVYVRDLATSTTTEVAGEGAEEGAFSTDGRYLLFTSAAPGLSPEANGGYQVYRRDLRSGETALVSRGAPSVSAPLGEAADGEAFEAVFVGAGDCRVAFVGLGTSNLTPGGEDPALGVYLRDFCGATPSTALVSVREDGEPFEEATSPSATAAGLVGFVGVNLFPEVTHFYLRDPAAGETVLLDRASGAGGEPGDGAVAGGARLATVGCRALFVSAAGNLLGAEGPLPGGQQALVRQLAPCATAPPSHPGPGAGGAGPGGPSGGRPVPAASSPAPARRVGIGGLGRRVARLSFDGAGRARIRIQRLVAGGRGQWTLVRSLVVTAAEAGVVRVELPPLPAGRYRLKLRLQGDPDNPILTRRLGGSARGRPRAEAPQPSEWPASKPSR